MAVVTFVDTAGTSWEVFQVRRASVKEGAVSPGREAGWLTFTSDVERRRFAPVPPDWEVLPAPALEELCRAALPVELRQSQTRHASQPASESGSGSGSESESQRPRIAEPSLVVAPPAGHIAEAAATRAPADPPLSAELQNAAKAHGRTARRDGQTVVAALLALRSVLAAHGVEPASETFRQARRSFLDAYYFEAARPDINRADV